MAQQTSPVPNKSTGQQYSAAEFNAQKAVIDNNANDAQARLALMENATVVKSLSDLPAPVANEIILPDGVYQFIGTIDLDGNTLIVNGTTVSICGQGPAFTTIYENAVTAIHVKSGYLNIDNIALSGGGVTTHIGVMVDPGATFVYESGLVLEFGIPIKANNVLLMSINRIQFFGNDISIQILGSSTVNKISIFLCDFVDYITTGFELAAGAKVGQLILANSAFSSVALTNAIVTEAGSVNIELRAVISSCTFNGAGDALSGLLEKDIKFEFTSCFGVFNSTDYGFIHFENPSDNDTEIDVAGTWYPISAVGASWVVDPESARFSETADGELTYIGINKNVAECEFEITAKTGVGTTNNYEIGISVDGAAPLPLSTIPIVILNTGRVASWSFPTLLDVIGKKWQLQVRGIGTTTNVEFLAAHLRNKRV